MDILLLLSLKLFSDSVPRDIRFTELQLIGAAFNVTYKSIVREPSRYRKVYYLSFDGAPIQNLNSTHESRHDVTIAQSVIIMELLEHIGHLS